MDAILDGRLMTSRAAAHDHLAERLSLPAYYGRNLDALYDLLTSYPERLDITVTGKEEMLFNLGDYTNALLETLFDASRQHSNVTVTILNENIENNS